MDTDSFVIHTKSKDSNEDIADNVKKDLIHQIMTSIDDRSQVKIKR